MRFTQPVAVPVGPVPGDSTCIATTNTPTGITPVLAAWDTRQTAVAAMTQAIAGLETTGKLTAPNATLLRRIAANPAVGEQSLRLVTEGIGHLGKQYNWGSAGPDEFDCSGLTLYCARQTLGLALPDTAAHQFETIPIKVPRAKLQPGDLVFFGKKSITHVAIYLAENMMLEAGGEGQVPTNDGSVRIRTVRSDYKGARRVVTDGPANRPAHAGA